MRPYWQHSLFSSLANILRYLSFIFSCNSNQWRNWQNSTGKRVFHLWTLHFQISWWARKCFKRGQFLACFVVDNHLSCDLWFVVFFCQRQLSKCLLVLFFSVSFASVKWINHEINKNKSIIGRFEIS